MEQTVRNSAKNQIIAICDRFGNLFREYMDKCMNSETENHCRILIRAFSEAGLYETFETGIF